MIERLASSDLTVGQLAEPLTMSRAAALKHVQVFGRASIVHRTVEGRRHVRRLEAGPMALAYAWLRFYEHFWKKRLDALQPLFNNAASQKNEENR